jgi:hypothetical protein
LILVWMVGCAHRGPARLAPADQSPGELTASYTTQSLYRVDVQGDGRSGRMRLVLRDDPAHPAAGFHLAAADSFGRPLWTLAEAGSAVGVVDHRGHAFCRASAGVTLPEAGLAGLPPEVLPRLLRGLLPIEPVGPIESTAADGDAIDFRDAAGRRWTATFEGGEPVTWTLWQEGRPLLWWQRQPGGGVLSHREGSQFRWRQSVVEQHAGEFVLQVPEDYHHADCATWDLSEFRQDQPAPAGDRPPR